EKEMEADACQALAAGLAAVAGRLKPTEAAKLYVPLIEKRTRSAEIASGGWQQLYLEQAVASLIDALDPELAADYSRRLAFNLCCGRDANYFLDLSRYEDDLIFRTDNLDALLTKAGR